MKEVVYPVLPLFGLLFVGLKLTGHITWPWLWVLAPFWVGFAVLAAIILMLLIGFGIVASFGNLRR